MGTQILQRAPLRVASGRSLKALGPRWSVNVLALCAAALLAGGCGTLHEDRESDIPWNTPQPWENAPMIPGLENM